MSERNKTELYNAIHIDSNIKDELMEWLQKIFKFIDIIKNGQEYDNFFLNVPEKKKMCGYVEVSSMVETINENTIENINQRVLLTTIYRFARMFYILLWYVIYNLGKQDENVNIDTIMNIFKKDDNTFIFSRDELQRHARYVLQKHGIRPFITEHERNDPINKLYHYLLKGEDELIRNNVSKFPSIFTSLTQPIGNDPVNVWMNYDTRMKYNTPIQHNITNQFLTSFGAGLCVLEQEIHIGLGNTDNIKWECGTNLFYVNPYSAFHYIAKRNNKYMRTGPSSTTNMMLDCALLFNIDAKKVLLALVPWMELVKDHSIFEILIAANSYIPDLDYKLEKHDTGNGNGTNNGNDVLELKAINKLYNKVIPQRSTGGSKIEKKKSNKKIKKQKGGDLPMDDYQKYDDMFQEKGKEYYPQCDKSSAICLNPQCDKSSAICLIADAWNPKIKVPEINIDSLPREGGINISSEYYLNKQDDKRNHAELSKLQIPFAFNSKQSKEYLNSSLITKTGQNVITESIRTSLSAVPSASTAAGGKKKQKTKAKKPKN